MENLTITGNLGADAEVKQKSDYYLTHFSVACTRRYTNSDGEKIESTNWYSVMRRTKKEPGKIMNHLKKGNKVLVTGQPSYGINTHGNGVKAEIIVNCEKLEILSFDNSIKEETQNSENSESQDFNGLP